MIDFVWGERKRDISLLSHLLVHSLDASCMCPDGGPNLQPWHIRTMLSPAKLSSQGPFSTSLCSQVFSLLETLECLTSTEACSV